MHNPSGRVVAAIFNKSIAGATTDLFAADITPPEVEKTASSATPTTIVGQPAVAYRVTVSLGTSVKLHLNYTDGVTEVDVPFNSDVALVANALYTFTFSAPRYALVGAAAGTVTAMTWNMQLSGAATVNYCIVEEIDGGVL